MSIKSKLIYVCDRHRHLICVPYSIENLHQMAKELDIKKGWFHKNHYDIPKKRIEEITKKCKVVDRRLIVDIIRRPDLAVELISDEGGEFTREKDHFIVSQLKYDGHDK